jgi:hypothetical protein
MPPDGCAASRVAVWVKASRAVTHDRDDNVLVRLRPIASSCSRPIDGMPITTVVNDWQTCHTWLADSRTFVEMTNRQRKGRHIRARTAERVHTSTLDAMDELQCMLETPRWKKHSGAYYWPLMASLELQASAAVHFLCLVRGRLANGALAPEIWRLVVLQTLPCVRDFGYRRLGPWVEMHALPAYTQVPTGNDVLAGGHFFGLLDPADAKSWQQLGAQWIGATKSAASSDDFGGGTESQRGDVELNVEVQVASTPTVVVTPPTVAAQPPPAPAPDAVSSTELPSGSTLNDNAPSPSAASGSDSVPLPTAAHGHAHEAHPHPQAGVPTTTTLLIGVSGGVSVCLNIGGSIGV